MIPMIRRLFLIVMMAAMFGMMVSTYAQAQEPVAGALADAGVLVVIPEPGVDLPQPDIISAPGDAYRAGQDIYERTGLWATILYGLFLIGKTAGRRSGPGTWLGTGGRAALVFAGTGLVGAWADVLLTPTSWMVALTQSIFFVGMILQAVVSHEPKKT